MSLPLLRTLDNWVKGLEPSGMNRERFILTFYGGDLLSAVVWMERKRAMSVIHSWKNLSRSNQQPRSGRNGLYYTGLWKCFQAL